MELKDISKAFFIGIAGAGMSALAQYLRGSGITVSGSDRYFLKEPGSKTQEQLEREGITCFAQGKAVIDASTDVVIASTAIEDSVPEVKLAKALNIPIIKRSSLLAMIAASRKTIAVGGTSGKSTTAAMIYDILKFAGLDPGIISGAGLTALIRENKIGNAAVGNGEWLVIEADESDGSIVEYRPEVSLLLNIDKDHQEISELMVLFKTFVDNAKGFVTVNLDNKLAASLSKNTAHDFSTHRKDAGYHCSNFRQDGMVISFAINEVPFRMKAIGTHNMENALAAVAVCNIAGVPLETASLALAGYEGIYRRTQILGQANGVWVIDDYAHNPAKCAAAIRACQPFSEKLVAWFQPHGYGPTKFLRKEFVEEIAAALRPQDEIWMSEIFYAGGTAVKDISSGDLINDLKALGVNAFFLEDRNELPEMLKSHLHTGCTLLLMGARDPGLEAFSKYVFEKLST